MNAAGLVTTIRKTRGDDIDAACGQLAGDVKDRTRAVERMAERRASGAVSTSGRTIVLHPVRDTKPASKISQISNTPNIQEH